MKKNIFKVLKLTIVLYSIFVIVGILFRSAVSNENLSALVDSYIRLFVYSYVMGLFGGGWFFALTIIFFLLLKYKYVKVKSDLTGYLISFGLCILIGGIFIIFDETALIGRIHLLIESLAMGFFMNYFDNRFNKSQSVKKGN